MRTMPSPTQYISKEQITTAVMLRMMRDLMNAHEKFLKKSDEIASIVHSKLIPGPKGEDGKTPTKEEIRAVLVSVLNRKMIEEIIAPMIPKVKDGKDGQDGKDAEITESHLDTIAEKAFKKIKVKNGKDAVITDEHIEKAAKRAAEMVEVPEIDPMSIFEMIEKMPKGKRLKTDFIDGFEQTITSMFHQLARGYLHGGGDTIKAGSNITITINSDGTKTVSSSASPFPQLTQAQINALTPTNGQTVYNIDLGAPQIYVNGVWGIILLN